MDPEQLAQLLAQAEQAIDENGDLLAINEIIKQRSGEGGLEGLRSRVEANEFAREADLLERVAERGPVANTIGMMLEGGSMGLASRIMNLFEGPGDEFRQGVAENREAAPVASLTSELSGGLLTPSLFAARAAQTGSSVARGAVGTGLLGGATGGMIGLARQEEGTIPERIRSAIPEAVVGTATGFLGGAAGAFLSPRTRRAFTNPRPGPRIADELENTVRPGVTRHINRIRNRADQRIGVARQGLEELDNANPELVSDALEDFLDGIRSSDAGSALSSASREVATGSRFASLKDMRNLAENLRRGKFFNEREQLIGILEDEVEGFGAANSRFFRENAVLEALEAGESGGGSIFRGPKLKTSTGANIERSIQQLPDHTHDAFRSGVLSREMKKFTGGETGGSVSVLNKLIDDVSTEGILRDMFDSEAAADQFIDLVREQVGAAQLRTFLRKAGIGVAVVGGLAAAGGTGAVVARSVIP